MRILRYTFAGIFCLLAVFLSGSVIKKDEVSKLGDEAEWIPYDFDLSEYIVLGDLSSIAADFEDPTVCTEGEVDAAIFQILLREASFEEKNGPAERYNKVRIDFSVLLEGKVLEEYSHSDYDLVIGMETENPVETLLGETLMGARVGETRSVEYRYPDAVIKEEITGKTVTLYATVKAVYRQTIPELIDAFVQQMGIGLDSVQALRESVRIDLLEEKELARVQAVWLAILEDVSVLSYPEKELSASMEQYRLYYENLAELYGVEFEDLLKVYCKLDSESFEAQMRAAAEEKVKNDMIFTQLVRLQEISLSEEEYEEGAWRYFEKEEGEFSSFEEFEKSYTKEALWQNLLWDKALLSVAERAVPAKNQ